jgi:hypothetical protein
VEAKLIMPVPLVEAEQKGRENALNGVKQRGFRVRVVAALEALVGPSEDLEDVRLLGEFGDFEEVLRNITRVVVVVLVAERLCLSVRRLSSNEQSDDWPLTSDEVPEDIESSLLIVTLSNLECQFRLLIAFDLEDLIDDVEHRLALLVHVLDLGKADLTLTGERRLGGLEPAEEAATPKRTTVAFNSVASLRTNRH